MAFFKRLARQFEKTEMDTVLFSSELFTDNTASAMTPTANEKTPTFEEAMAELDALVRKLEKSKLALE